MPQPPNQQHPIAPRPNQGYPPQPPPPPRPNTGVTATGRHTVVSRGDGGPVSEPLTITTTTITTITTTTVTTVTPTQSITATNTNIRVNSNVVQSGGSQQGRPRAPGPGIRSLKMRRRRETTRRETRREQKTRG
ncbi:hypothetical protein VTJ49DRAFT_1372 [Mycothermus thermophilus]|uniref:Uncharacterized protein n=1 Tax=Humicola insolens TaxID=85995 RepID=A0ABR3VNU1_HUMIN